MPIKLNATLPWERRYTWWTILFIVGGINASSMSVLTPYAAQVISLSSRLRMSHPEVTVSTIDRSQGDIFITSVETNEGSPGFDFRF